MHEEEASALGLDYEYRIFDLIELGKHAEDVGSLLEEARRLGYAAMNITHPCKQLVLEIVDELDPDAEHLGAVNLVVFDDDRLIGYNTDWMGYRDGLLSTLPGASFERVVQIGCGGAGAATAYALSCGTSRLDLYDVEDPRAEDLAERMRVHFPTQAVATVPTEDLPAAIARATGVVHATPLGMLHHQGVAFDVGPPPGFMGLRCRVSAAGDRAHPASRRARPSRAGWWSDGCRPGIRQSSIITGEQPDRNRMERHFRTLVDAEERVAGS